MQWMYVTQQFQNFDLQWMIPPMVEFLFSIPNTFTVDNRNIFKELQCK